MKWNRLRIDVDIQPSDPGMCGHSSEVTDYDREQLRVGEKIRFKDSGGLMGPVTLKAIDDAGVTLLIGKEKEVRIEKENYVKVDGGGRDYTNFGLYIRIFEEPVLYRYQFFSVTEEQLQKWRDSDCPADLCQLGRWYWFTAPTDDYLQHAESLFRKAYDDGYAAAGYYLSEMTRLGELESVVDMEQYEKLLNEAAERGCEAARMRQVYNVVLGVNCQCDLDAAIVMAKDRIKELEAPDPEWYDVLGTLYQSSVDCGREEDREPAIECFRKAIAGGFVEPYSGLLDLCPEELPNALKAGCPAAYIVKADGVKDKKAHRKELVECYQKALDGGDTMGAYCMGMLFRDEGNDEEAWRWFWRGCQLGDAACMTEMAGMGQEGRAPEWVNFHEVCLFRLRALRYGDDSQLEPVVEAWVHEAELQDFDSEMKNLWYPRYKELQEEDEDYDDEPEDDDGRFDPWA
ncbi:MAG: hypothetical protein J6Y52_04975 [Bacteroidales bacterium]|nr:hypothetical protein [Bacteroidales bacterium]